MLYFAYGSNMSARRLRARVSSARKILVAGLSGHQLRFRKIGGDGSAKCDVAATGVARHLVIGVVFDISTGDKARLDRFEGLGSGYEEKEVAVASGDGAQLRALTYYATRCDPSLHPFHWYKEHVLRGARENNLPGPYVRAIARVVSVTDPVPGRQERETAIYR